MTRDELKKIRMENLRKFFENRPLPEKDSSLISQLYNGKISFGEKVSRRLEKEYDMGAYYLDTPTQINEANNTVFHGTQNNIQSGHQTNYTNNFLSDITPEQAQVRLNEQDAAFLTDMPILGIDDGVEFALNPAEKGLKLKDKTQRAATFIPHSDRTFAVKMADNMLSDITPSPILQNDILIVEPLIAPRDKDLVLVCLDYQTPRQRGIFARLQMDLIGNFSIKHSEQPFERLPENALICGVVVEIKRRLLPNDLVLSRIDVNWDILNTLQRT